MKDAGIKVWVLTGDKIETAINIGFSAGLLDNSFNQIIIDELDHHELIGQLQRADDSIIEAEKNFGNP